MRWGNTTLGTYVFHFYFLDYAKTQHFQNIAVQEERCLNSLVSAWYGTPGKVTAVFSASFRKRAVP